MKRRTKPRWSRRLFCEPLEDRLTPAFSEFLDPNPVNGNAFGNQVVPLANGNVAITSPNDDFNGTNTGAVYLYNGATGKLISALRGSTANDTVGSGGITALPNGNFVIVSPNWDSPTGISNVGAVTFVNGTTGLSGTVSASNSLVGSTASDSVGSTGIIVLSSGNYLVRSASYDFLGTVDSGALTFGSGTKGVSGAISAANSLVCTAANTNIGNVTPTELANGHYVVRTSNWDNGAATNAGAVTWGSGTTGVSGVISAAISLVGSTTNDTVGNSTPTLLPNGDYVVAATAWDNGATTGVGAVTLCNGTTGRVGVVSAANSLVGSTASDQVGSNGITVLPNGNFLVGSSSWDNGAAGNAGAVTFVNGVTGLTGAVSAVNSLVGSTASDSVGANAPVVLANGNYVVRSNLWNNGGTTDTGAVTWGNGSTGVAGAISAANSLVGTLVSEQLGSSGVTALPNGHYVVASPLWSGAATSAGAVTWCNGLTGRVGAVSAANSLVGSTASDSVGSGGITVLADGNYVIRTQGWDNGAIAGVGSVTWVSGSTGSPVGAVSSANSLIGNSANDTIGSGSVTALANGNFVVVSPLFDNGVTADVGAFTWCKSAPSATVGNITLTNSLIGSTVNDGLDMAVTVLPNGNFLMASPKWDNGAAANAGAVTWGNGAGGTVGQINSGNSLVGSTANDQVSINGVTVLANGNYVVRSSTWDNGAATDAGAVTWGSGASGVSGIISKTNSLIGSTTNDQLGSGNITLLPNGHYVVRAQDWDNGAAADAGAVTWGNGATGVAGEVSAANSLVGTISGSFVGSNGVTSLGNGNYIVPSTSWDATGIGGNEGAVTFGDGNTGISGPVSAANSLVGSTTGDAVGNLVQVLSDGDYIVTSPVWNYGSLVDSGAMTWGSGTTGLRGAVSPANSIVGLAGTAGLAATPILDDVNDTFIARFTIESFGGKVRIGSQSSGVIPTFSTVYVDDNVALAPGSTIPDADQGTSGNQPARSGENFFPNIPDALSRLVPGGELVLNEGTFPANVAMFNPFEIAVNGFQTAKISGAVSGPFGIRKEGIGNLQLTGSNSFTGDIEINRGSLQFNADTALGNSANTVTLSSLGTLNAIAGVNTGRAVALNGGTLFVGTASILNGANIAGGRIDAPGGLTTATAGATLTNVTLTAASSLTLGTTSDLLDTVSNFGTVSVPGTFVIASSFRNEASGVLTVPVGGQLVGAGFDTFGQMTVAGMFSSSSLPVTFAGGSVTTVNSGGIMDVGPQVWRVAGGLVKNSGTFSTSSGGKITVDYNGRVQGTGTFGSIVTQNGGVFAPGASPGTATTNQYNLNGGGTLEFEVTNASGTPGAVNGWDLVNVQPTVFSPTGLMNYTATPSNRYNILLRSRLNDGVGNTKGAIDNFNSALSYAWKFADGSNVNTSSSGTFDASAFAIDTSGFTNAFTGGFSVELRDAGKNLYVVYTPVAGPFVTGFTVNNGDVQRSRLTTIAVNFAAPTDAAALAVPGAITLTRTAALPGGIVGMVVTVGSGLVVSPGSGMVMGVTLTFDNIVNAGIDSASLGDGYWRLAIPSAGFLSPLNDPILRRLFGDVDNNGTVDGAVDFPAFGAEFNSTGANLAFDFNNDGTVDGAVDFPAFGARFNSTL